MDLRMIKDIIGLLERSGVPDNIPVNITVEKYPEIKRWTMTFNIAEIKNGRPSKIEIKVKEDESFQQF